MLSIHHFTDLPAAFAGIGRVLRPVGRAAIFTATPKQMGRFWVNDYFPEMMARDYAQWPAIERMAPLMAENQLRLTDIAPVFITADTADFFVYSGKLRPEMYLSEDTAPACPVFARGSQTPSWPPVWLVWRPISPTARLAESSPRALTTSATVALSP